MSYLLEAAHKCIDETRHTFSTPQQVSSLIGEQTKEYFKALTESVRSSSSILKGFLIEHNSAAGLTASRSIVPSIAKQVRPHAIAEDLIIPAIMDAYRVANISNPGSVLNSIHLSNNNISSRITDIVDNVNSILIQERRCSKFSLTVDESTFANQSVFLTFVRCLKFSGICEELLFMRTLINTTGKHVCNDVTEFFTTNEISMDNMISFCTYVAPSMLGKRKGIVFRLIGDRSVSTIHCALHCENLVAKILATVILSPHFKRLFHLSTK